MAYTQIPSRTLIRREARVGPSNREIHPENWEKEDDPDDDYVYGERWCSINERERTEQWSWIILEMPEHCLFNLFRLRCLWTAVYIWASMISLTNFIIHLCSAGMLWYCINSTSSQTRTSNFALFVIIFLRFHPVIDLMSWLESSSVQALILSMKLSNFLIKSSWHAPRRSAVLQCIYAS